VDPLVRRLVIALVLFTSSASFADDRAIRFIDESLTKITIDPTRWNFTQDVRVFLLQNIREKVRREQVSVDHYPLFRDSIRGHLLTILSNHTAFLGVQRDALEIFDRLNLWRPEDSKTIAELFDRQSKNQISRRYYPFLIIHQDTLTPDVLMTLSNAFISRPHDRPSLSSLLLFEKESLPDNQLSLVLQSLLKYEQLGLDELLESETSFENFTPEVREHYLTALKKEMPLLLRNVILKMSDQWNSHHPGTVRAFGQAVRFRRSMEGRNLTEEQRQEITDFFEKVKAGSCDLFLE
jgi:hypothetical protein